MTSIKTVSEILGHSNITITYNTYIHLINDQEKAAISNLNRMNKPKTALSQIGADSSEAAGNEHKRQIYPRINRAAAHTQVDLTLTY